ncbi:MAG: cysteine rich repeat-containing protein [Hyphomicrobiales bacterium]|nr:cysteine rich repeat-containing protein [Hyphomicrobiales bacterium]
MKSLLSIAALALTLSGGVALAQTAAQKMACKADFEKLCPGVQPGGGRPLECLSKQLDALSPECKTVVEANMPK